MITIDRSSSTSIHDQLREQLRYQIVSGHYQVDSILPSTRRLAAQLDVSFHTVRKVYRELEEEGLLEVRPGAGYVVLQRVPLAKSERMERGASIIQQALKSLVGLGLSDDEVEYLFQEQLALLDTGSSNIKLVAAFPYREMAALCAEELEHHIQQPVHPATLDELGRHHDADYAVTPFAHMKEVMQALPRADVIGIYTHLSPDALERIARLLDTQTLGVITRYPDAIPPLTAEIRGATTFSGQMIAASVEDSTDHLRQFVNQTDLVVYTPMCRRRVLGLLEKDHPRAVIAPVIVEESIRAVRQTIPA